MINSSTKANGIFRLLMLIDPETIKDTFLRILCLSCLDNDQGGFFNSHNLKAVEYTHEKKTDRTLALIYLYLNMKKTVTRYPTPNIMDMKNVIEIVAKV